MKIEEEEYLPAKKQVEESLYSFVLNVMEEEDE